jgi:DNA helicase HerA-like ATPase
MPERENEGKRKGVVIGKSTGSRFTFLVTGKVERNDLVQVRDRDNSIVLGRVDRLEMVSDLTAERASEMLEGSNNGYQEHEVATVSVIGRISGEKSVFSGVPVPAGETVERADEEIIRKVFNFSNSGACIGLLRGTGVKVTLDIEKLIQRHISILAKTGAGKSYLAGVLIEEMIKNQVTTLIIDPHGEYHTLSEPAMDSWEEYVPRVGLFAVDDSLNPGCKKVSFTLSNFRASELVSATALASNRSAELLLSQWLEEAGGQNVTPESLLSIEPDNPLGYQLKEELRTLFKQPVFAGKGTPVTEIISEGRTSVLSLKGISPELQALCTERLLSALFELRKREKIPPLLCVIEEAHNFCPQQGVSPSGRIIRTVASEGRKFGLWLMIITQRPAKVDKNVISQCNTQFILKVTNANDLRAIASSVEGMTSGILEEIPSLETGLAVAVGGGLVEPVLIEVRKRESRHGGENVSVSRRVELHEEVES